MCDNPGGVPWTRRPSGRVRRSVRAGVLGVVFGFAVGHLCPAPAAGQTSSIDRAREAQRDFERVRRRDFERDAWADGRCHEHIGRLCLVHDRDDDWVRPPEGSSVTGARARLLAVLDSVQGDVGEDPWLTGQRVKYHLESGDTLTATAAARSCGDGWRCESLRGFVEHLRGNTLDAEVRFRRALESMPEPVHCRRTDISALLDKDDRRTYARLPCGSPEREAHEERFWHLSDPVWSTEGRERRAEHFSRHVWADLHEDAASGYGLSWGDDLYEITIRYGWPEGWDVAWRRDPGIRTERSIEAHRAAHAQRFAVRGVGSPAPEWDLDADRPASTWAWPMGRIDPLGGYQLAAFRRGDRRVFVGAAWSGEAMECDSETNLLLSSDREVVARSSGRVGILLHEPSADAGSFIGLETECSVGAGARRLRIPAPGTGKSISDLLLLHPAGELPGTLDATLPFVRRDLRMRPGETVVVFWEWYGPAEPASVTLSLSRENRGFWRNALEFVGLADRGIDSAGIRWSEAGETGTFPRAMEMTLPDLAEGEYRLTLQVQTARLGSVSATRDIVVAR